VVVSSAMFLLLLMLFGFVSRESATHTQERAPHKRSKKKGVCACSFGVYFLCTSCVGNFCCWCVTVFVVEFRGVCVVCSMLISGGGYGFWGVLEDGLSVHSV
jgi:hypothetical protein